MKIEREQNGSYSRWSVELDRWVARALIGFPAALAATAWSLFLGPLRTLLGG